MHKNKAKKKLYFYGNFFHKLKKPVDIRKKQRYNDFVKKITLIK